MSLLKSNRKKKKNIKKSSNKAVADTAKVLSGIVTGVATALLLAPQSGRKTREQLKDGASEVGDTVSEKSKEIGQATKDQVNNVKNQVKEKTNL